MWRDLAAGADRVLERVDHDGWSVEARRAPLGLVAFVFEGRPNVLADATGVLRGGNTVVFRIGSDALGTARAIIDHALAPALRRAPGCRRARCSWSTRRARRRLGAVLRPPRRASPSPAARARPSPSSARSPARPASRSACTAPAARGWSPTRRRRPPSASRRTVAASLDRKVCNTLERVLRHRRRRRPRARRRRRRRGRSGGARGGRRASTRSAPTPPSASAASASSGR